MEHSWSEYNPDFMDISTEDLNEITDFLRTQFSENEPNPNSQESITGPNFGTLPRPRSAHRTGPSAHASYTTIANPNSTAAPNAPSPRHPSQGPLNQWPGMSSYGSHNTPDPNVTTASSVHRSTKVHNRGLSPYGPYNTNHNFKAASSTSSTRYPSGSIARPNISSLSQPNRLQWENPQAFSLYESQQSLVSSDTGSASLVSFGDPETLDTPPVEQPTPASAWPQTSILSGFHGNQPPAVNTTSTTSQTVAGNAQLPAGPPPATQRDILQLKESIEKLVATMDLREKSPSMNKDKFCAKFPIWAQMLECILDLVIVFVLYDTNLDLANILVKPGSKPHPALVVITSRVYQLILEAHLEDGGSNVAENEALEYVSPGVQKWGPEFVIQFCQSFRREARDLVLGYGFSIQESEAYNTEMYESWTTDAKYLHWYDSTGKIQSPYAHPIIMKLFRLRVYDADDSAAKKLNRVLGRYPSLRNKVPDIKDAPYNGYSLSVAGTRHGLSEWRSGSLKPKKWNDSDRSRPAVLDAHFKKSNRDQTRIQQICLSCGKTWHAALRLVNRLKVHFSEESDGHHPSEGEL